MTKPVTVAAVSLALSLGLLAGLAKGPVGGSTGRPASAPVPTAKLYQERLPALDAAPRHVDEAPARIRLARQG